MSVETFKYDLSVDRVSSESTGNKDADVIQQNPAWILTFIPFTIRDTKNVLRASRSDKAALSRPPFVVVNDCVTLNISHSKASPFGSLEAVLRSGDIDYLTAIAPGDYLLAWMHTSTDKISEVETKIRTNQDANQFDSGFKFIGKVESVREKLTTTPTGIKQLVYQISAFSFQEFNTKVYQNFFDAVNPAILFGNLREEWIKALTEIGKKSDNVQDLVRSFVQILMGVGPGDTQIGPILATPNEAFVIPDQVGKLLKRTSKGKGSSGLKYTDILTMIQGIQQYSRGSQNNPSGFLPSNLRSGKSIPANNAAPDIRTYITKDKCEGVNFTFPAKFSDVPIWSLLLQYTNTVINELYACLRVDRDHRIVPTLTMRQIPFSTEAFKAENRNEKVTLFMNLPRWKLHPSMVISHDIGRSNALRINYVQIWGSMGNQEQGIGSTHAYQAEKAPQLDSNDIKRSGLRTYIATSSLDFIDTSEYSKVISWSRKSSDWLINGHLKTNGTIITTGISEPICPGDNLEWNNTVFHIEQVAHTASVNPNGTKYFRTILRVSNGLHIDSNANATIFPNMKGEYRENIEERDVENIYPGYSDVQDIPDRKGGEKIQNRKSQDLSGASNISSKDRGAKEEKVRTESNKVNFNPEDFT